VAEVDAVIAKVAASANPPPAAALERSRAVAREFVKERNKLLWGYPDWLRGYWAKVTRANR
jgi:hypothetical protein